MNGGDTPSTPAADAPRSPELGLSLDLGGIETNFHDVGTGAPVLLIHGSGPGVTAWANWRLVIPELSGRFRVVAPDMAGFGYTRTPADWTPGIDAWVGQAVALLDALKLERVALVGNSFGGSISLHLADRHPDRVSRIVLMGAVGVSFPITDGLEKVWGYEPSEAAMRELMRVFAYDQGLISSDLVQMRYRASIRDDVQERFARLFPAPRQRWLDALALPPERLARLNRPVLLVHGQQDQVIPFEASERLAALLPNARLHPVDRCGHWVQIEHTREFIDQVTAFLAAED